MSARPLILARLTACELPDASATSRAGRESSEHERTVEQRLRSDAAGTDTDDDDADTLALSLAAQTFCNTRMLRNMHFLFVLLVTFFAEGRGHCTTLAVAPLLV